MFDKNAQIKAEKEGKRKQRTKAMIKNQSPTGYILILLFMNSHFFYDTSMKPVYSARPMQNVCIFQGGGIPLRFGTK